MKKYYIKILYFAPVIVLGALIFIYGEFDDSPGAQLLGLIIAAFAIIMIVKKKKLQITTKK